MAPESSVQLGLRRFMRLMRLSLVKVAKVIKVAKEAKVVHAVRVGAGLNSLVFNA